LKVLQIINVRWYNATAYYALLLSKVLQEKSHKVILAGNHDTPVTKKAQQNGLQVFDSLNLNTDNPLHFFKNIFVLKKYIENEKIDIVNCHRGEMYLAIAIASRLANNKPLLIRTRGDQRAPKNNFLNRLVHRFFVDQVIVTTVKLKERYHELSFPQNKISVIYGGVGTKFLQTPQSKSDLNQRFVFGILGRLSPVKGHHNLIKAFAELLTKYPDCELQIGGGDCEISAEQLKNYASDLGVASQIRVLGFVEDEIAFIDGLDCAMVASTGSEMISRVLYEYGARKKLCLVTPVNSLNEVIKNNRNGIVANGITSADLLESMQNIMQIPAAERNRMAEQFYQDVEKNYQPENFYAETMRVYQQK